MANGTDGRVYGGDPSLIHVKDKTRAEMGRRLAGSLDDEMRYQAFQGGMRTQAEAFGENRQKLCPGCYMVVGYDMLLQLADANGQSRTELARSMIGAFQKLLDNPELGLTEEIEVLLDPPNCGLPPKTNNP